MSTYLEEMIGPTLVQVDGVDMPRRRALNFTGCTATDDEANERTTITLTTIGASDAALDTTDFAGTLSASDNTAQKAFDTLDDISAVDIPIVDSGGYTSSTEVESALAELYGYNRILTKTLTATHATITAAAGTETVNIGTAMPTKCIIVGATLSGYTPFTGGTISDFTVDIGSSGDVDAIVDGANLFAAGVDGCPSTTPSGIQPNKYFAAATQLTATFACGSDDVADATAGEITITVSYARLP